MEKETKKQRKIRKKEELEQLGREFGYYFGVRGFFQSFQSIIFIVLGIALVVTTLSSGTSGRDLYFFPVSIALLFGYMTFYPKWIKLILEFALFQFLLTGWAGILLYTIKNIFPSKSLWKNELPIIFSFVFSYFTIITAYNETQMSFFQSAQNYNIVEFSIALLVYMLLYKAERSKPKQKVEKRFNNNQQDKVEKKETSPSPESGIYQGKKRSRLERHIKN